MILCERRLGLRKDHPEFMVKKPFGSISKWVFNFNT